MKLKKLFMIFWVILMSQECFAENDSQVGRYLTVTNQPQYAQIYVLSQIIQLRFPVNVKTVGDAMSYLLQFSGYSLIPSENMDSAFKITLSKPLPLIDRNLGPITLKDGLITLAGTAFYLIHDPVNRTVNFKLKPKYFNTSDKGE
jgi:conjugative transfer region protein (TIGR03748 family)